MATLINYTTQQLIKPISENNAGRFEQIMLETEVKDLQPLLGVSLYQDLIQNSAEPKYVTLIEGTTWTLNGKPYIMKGLKYVIAYLFYANYVEQVAIADTFSGFVQHTFAESQHIEAVEKRRIASINREIAARYFEEVRMYINHANVTYSEFIGDGEQVFSPKIERLDMIGRGQGIDGRCEVTGKFIKL